MNKIKMLSSDIVEMDARFRAAFVNSLSGFKSASLIGTINSAGISNLSIFSSVLHIGSDPALIGCIVRPDSSPRHTLSNILAQTYFTVNHVNEAIFKQAHQTSARYAENISEFSATGLTEEFSELFKAPYVKESNLKYGVEFVEKIELAVNGTILVIGKIVEVILPESKQFSGDRKSVV